MRDIVQLRFRRSGGELLFYHEVTTYLMVGCGFGALYATGEMGAAPTVITSLGMILSMLVFGDDERMGPRFWNVVVVGALAWGVYEWFFTEGGFVKAIVHFLAYVQIIRMNSRRTDRDTLWVYLLSLLQLTASAILTLSMSFFVFLFLYTLTGTSALMVFTLKRDAGDRVSPFKGKKLLTKAFFLINVGVALIAFISAILFFFTIPRLGTGYFGWVLRPKARISGFGKSIDIGAMGRIKLDRTTVMRVKI